MSERGMLAVVVAVAIGAYFPRPFPVIPIAGLAIILLVSRSPVMFCLVLLLLSSGLSFKSHRGLSSELAGPVDEWATLVNDPKAIGSGVRVDVRLDSKRYEVVAFGWAASRMKQAELGDRIHIRGSVDSDQPASSWKWRHVVARIDLRWLGEIEPAAGLIGWSNSVRHLLGNGVNPLPLRERSLILGFVIGDDSEQPQALKQAFRDSGLTHLLAVSGQNVAFVLAVLAPLLARVDRRMSILVIVVALMLFGTMTRWEPSVLRATVMVGSATLSRFAGRKLSGTRSLSLAVALLLLVDPLLLWSVGFGLSVGASAGILLLSAPIEQRLRGPQWVRSALAITTSAQLGVSPLLVWVFNGVPLAAVPANLLAGPMAGPVMVWGLTAGLLAGVVGGFWAEVIHFPTRLAVSWVALMAEFWAGLELPIIGLRELLALALVAFWFWMSQRSPARRDVTTVE